MDRSGKRSGYRWARILRSKDYQLEEFFRRSVSIYRDRDRNSRLSEIMGESDITDYIPNIFDHAAHLSAVLLMDMLAFSFVRCQMVRKATLALNTSHPGYQCSKLRSRLMLYTLCY